MEYDERGNATDEFEFAERIDDGVTKPTLEEVPERVRIELEKFRTEHLQRNSSGSPPLPSLSLPEATSRSAEIGSTVGPKRTKNGTKLTSNDGKHFFNIGVWESKGYPGCTTIRLSVAGGNYMYTLDKTQMKALRLEISRGVPT